MFEEFDRVIFKGISKEGVLAILEVTNKLKTNDIWEFSEIVDAILSKAGMAALIQMSNGTLTVMGLPDLETEETA